MQKIFFFSERSMINAILRIKLEYMKVSLLFMKLKAICIAEDRIECFIAFLQFKLC